MLRTLLLLALLLAVPVFGQQQSPPTDSTPPQAENPQTTGVKKVLRRAAPNCINVAGHEDCWSEPAREKEAEEQSQNQQPPAPKGAPPPRSQSSGESSSKDTKIDPGTITSAPNDVQELHPYDPHRAEKDVEVGDFYFKRQNYFAAESRYAEALLWKPNDAIATFRLAEAQEKLGKIAEARKNYDSYLKLLPKGEFAPLAQKALVRLDLKMQSEKTGPISPPSRTRQ